MLSNIIITPYARKDIDFISDYSNEFSKFIISSILAVFSILSYFPLSWKLRKDWLREIIEPKYKFRILYKIEWTNIYIVSVFKWKDSF
jgi:hypothetical protein